MGDEGKRSCIFCGAIADDKEHLLPEWLQKILPSDETGIYTRQIVGEDAKTWRRKPFSEKAKFEGPEQLAPQMHPVLLNLNFMPPPQVTVWIGSHHRAVQDPTNSVYLQKPLWIIPDDDESRGALEFGYMSFLAVGGVSFLLVEHRFGSYVECVLGEEHPASQMFTKIWPRTRKVVSWPPYLMADRELIDLIFDPDTLPLGFDARVFSGRLRDEPFRNVF